MRNAVPAVMLPQNSSASSRYAVPFRSVAVWCIFLLVSIFSAGAVFANAQDLAGLEEGIKPYGSYHGGDIDSISMANGNLSLHIPIVSYPQRGGKLQLGFSVVYTNPVYTLTNTRLTPPNPPHGCSTYCWVWSLNYGTENAGRNALSITTNLPTMGAVWNCLVTPCALRNYEVVEPDGAVHQMSTTASNWISLDTTGYSYNSGSFTLTDRQGTNYAFTPVNGYPSTLASIEDVNGNVITPNYNSNALVSYTDTLGRVIPQPQSASTSACPTGNGLLTATRAQAWNFPGPNGLITTFTVCTAAFPIDLSYLCSGKTSCSAPTGTNAQVQSIVLPNGTSWNFAFDTTGALSQITLPTGGTISYTWAQYSYCFSNSSGATAAQLTTNALSRTVNDASGAHTWHYATTPTGGATGQTVQTIVTDPLGNDSVHILPPIVVSGTTTPCSVYEAELDEYSGSHTNGTFLRKTTTSYSTTGAWSVPYGPNIAMSVVPTSITKTDMTSGKSSQTTKSWDSGIALTGYGSGSNALYGDLLTQNDYDFTGSSPLRKTVNTYMALSGPNASSYLANNLLDLFYTTQVNNGSGTQMAYTTYGYDESGLQSSGVSEQHVAGEAHPGNQTSVHRWLNGSTTGTTNCAAVTTGYLVSNNIFYDTGEVQQSTDPCTYPTTFLYSSNYYGAFPTTITNALNQTTTYGYDINTGAVTSITDPNSQITSQDYDDMARLTLVSYPDGGSTKYCYTDGVPSACPSGNAGNAPFAVVVTKAITSSQNEISTATLDGLGRPSQTQLNSDSPSTTYTLTTYDALGRKSQVYNPTRCSAITTNCGETTWGYTTYNYDPLNRVTSMVEPDGSSVTTTYDQTNANSSGVCATVADETGKSRQSCMDGLGRMTGVWEDPGSSPHLNYETDYAYDALDNLLTGTQKGSNPTNARVRTFQYDPFSQLQSAVNPESGNILDAYDADGNLITKTAPLPNQTLGSTVVTSYVFDKLNRLTKKSYNDGITLMVQFAYEGNSLTGCPNDSPPSQTDSYPIGRRTSMCDGSGGTTWTHDKMGRILSERRSIAGVHGDYDTDVYNLDGSVGSVTSLGYQVAYTYSNAGRAITAKNSADPFNYVTSASYAPFGGLTAASLGAKPITVTDAYNDRMQPLLISASASASIISLCYDFHLSVAVTSGPCSFSAYSSGNNGNVFQIANKRDDNRTQNFAYDPLNRIWQAYTNGANWGETFSPSTLAAGTAFSAANAGIDAWGNLTNRSGVTGKSLYEGLSAAPASVQNQLNGYCNDSAGNLVLNSPCPQPPGTQFTPTYTYDAENRLIATAGMSYLYDGDGKRVEKCTAGSTPGTCATNPTGTMYWTGTGSDPLAETDLSGNVLENYVFFSGQRIARRDASTKAVHYYFSDHLGSHSLITDANGTMPPQEESDFYPYGGEIPVSGSDPNHYKFTGKERDNESGLDYFGARHYASSMGRWMVPDRLNLTSARLVNPTNTLNKYVYGGNNPLKYIDKDGKDITIFYRPPSGASGDYGHIMLGALNQATGKVGFLDYYPAGNVNGLGQGPGAFNTGNMSERAAQNADGKFATLTIQTSPEEAQKVLDLIGALKNGSAPDYSALTNNCTTVCEDVLHDLGLDFGDVFPSSYWGDVYNNFSADAQAHPIWTRMMGVHGTPGNEYGNPRNFPGVNNFSQWLFTLYQNQQQQPQPKACVEVDDGLGNHSKSCD